jgi:hypothetical protein
VIDGVASADRTGTPDRARLNARVTEFGYNVRMSYHDLLKLWQADQARTDLGHSHLLLTRGQRLKLRLFLGFAKVLRWCRLI